MSQKRAKLARAWHRMLFEHGSPDRIPDGTRDRVQRTRFSPREVERAASFFRRVNRRHNKDIAR